MCQVLEITYTSTCDRDWETLISPVVAFTVIVASFTLVQSVAGTPGFNLVQTWILKSVNSKSESPGLHEGSGTTLQEINSPLVIVYVASNWPSDSVTYLNLFPSHDQRV